MDWDSNMYVSCGLQQEMLGEIDHLNSYLVILYTEVPKLLDRFELKRIINSSHSYLPCIQTHVIFDALNPALKELNARPP
jgi:hypothetical protein